MRFCSGIALRIDGAKYLIAEAIRQMVLVKTQHTEVSFDLSFRSSPQELAVHVSLSVFNFQTASLQTRRQVTVRRTGLSPSVLRKRRRGAAQRRRRLDGWLIGPTQKTCQRAF
ncbi:hypothetical protein BOSEA31B_11793 [Hyphomicrobiales bacterium]|nr:hypothetical protein BOSEA31B_11793 [Hyphomicrobiales bacterium]